MSSEFSILAEARTASRDRRVSEAGRAALAAVVDGFLAGGENEDIQRRLCAGCQFTTFCGVVAAELGKDKDGAVPLEHVPFLSAHGIGVDPQGYSLCAGELVRRAATALNADEFVLDSDDLGKRLGFGEQLGDVLHLATDVITRRIESGQRL